jgi:hypothetical protein
VAHGYVVELTVGHVIMWHACRWRELAVVSDGNLIIPSGMSRGALATWLDRSRSG